MVTQRIGEDDEKNIDNNNMHRAHLILHALKSELPGYFCVSGRTIVI